MRSAPGRAQVKGRVAGHGNPVWRDTHQPSAVTAPAVQQCLDAGAALRGMTHMVRAGCAWLGCT